MSRQENQDSDTTGQMECPIALSLRSAQKASEAIRRCQAVPTSKSIRHKCLDCSGDSWREVQLCQVFDCPLWQCRFGKRPTTVLQKTPEWLDPVFVAVESHKQGLREMGCQEWLNPLTGQREPLNGEPEVSGEEEMPDDDVAGD